MSVAWDVLASNIRILNTAKWPTNKTFSNVTIIDIAQRILINSQEFVVNFFFASCFFFASILFKVLFPVDENNEHNGYNKKNSTPLKRAQRLQQSVC